MRCRPCSSSCTHNEKLFFLGAVSATVAQRGPGQSTKHNLNKVAVEPRYGPVLRELIVSDVCSAHVMQCVEPFSNYMKLIEHFSLVWYINILNITHKLLQLLIRVKN